MTLNVLKDLHDFGNRFSRKVNRVTDFVSLKKLVTSGTNVCTFGYDTTLAKQSLRL